MKIQREYYIIILHISQSFTYRFFYLIFIILLRIYGKNAEYIVKRTKRSNERMVYSEFESQ